MPAYWLFKSEPESYSFQHLLAEPNRTTGWDGVRNYQARNFLRDTVKKGDLVLFYHSNADPPHVAGICEVVETATPDATAFDPTSKYYDPDSKLAEPTWFQVHVRALQPLDPPVTLPQLRAEPELQGLELLRRGSRLSVMPVSPEHWKAILRLAGIKRIKRA